MSFPVIGAIQSFADVKRALDNIRSYFNKPQSGLNTTVFPAGSADLKVKNGRMVEFDESWILGSVKKNGGSVSTTESISAVVAGRSVNIPILEDGSGSGGSGSGGGGSPATFARARAYLATNQSVSGGKTKVALSNASFSSSVDYAGNKLTPRLAGYYQVSGCVNLVGIDATNAAILYFNNSAIAYSPYGSGYGGFVSDIIYFNGSTDYVELFVDVALANTVFGGAEYTFLSLAGPF